MTPIETRLEDCAEMMVYEGATEEEHRRMNFAFGFAIYGYLGDWRKANICDGFLRTTHPRLTDYGVRVLEQNAFRFLLESLKRK